MYELSIDYVVPDMIIRDDIYSRSGELLIKSMSVLKNSDIQAIKENGYLKVTLADLTELNQTHYQVLHSSNEFQNFVVIYHQSVQHFSRIVNTLNTGLDIQTDALLAIRDMILSCVHSGEQFIDYLYNMVPDEFEITYNHCLNCGILSYFFAKWCGYSKDELDQISICGFLFDIGKTKIDDKLIWKSDKLNPEELILMQHHIHLGYEILRNKNLPPHVISVLIMHHERLDGSGYPAGIKEGRIDPYAMLVGLADTYEALTHPRAQRPALTPFEAIQQIEEDGFYKFGEVNTRVIMERIAEGYLGRKVSLSDGTIGIIDEIHSDMVSRPTLKVDHYYIDLRSQLKLNITRML